jgi:hypothetical protein
MTPEQACRFEMPFGKYRGITLERIATTDSQGPGYLDWVMSLDNLGPDLKEALECFLAIHWVRDLVERAAEQRGGRVGSSEPIKNREKPKNWWEK